MDFQNIDFKKLLLTVDGRIARQNFWIGFAVLFVAGILNGLVIGSISWILASVVSIAMLFPAYCLSIKRSNDRGHPQTYVQGFFAYNFAVQILTLVGIIGFLGSFIAMLLGLIALGLAIWMLVDLGFLEGTKGPNQYGPDPVSTF